MGKDKTAAIKVIVVFMLLIAIGSGGADWYLKKTYDEKIDVLSTELQTTKEEAQILRELLSVTEQEFEKAQEELSQEISESKIESKEKLSELQDEIKGISIEGGDFSAVISDVVRSVVSIITNGGQGSGMFVTSDGFIVTNYHVIEGATSVAVVNYKQSMVTGQVIGFNKRFDIAVIKIPGTHKRIGFANSDKLKVGEKVVAIGNPAGLGFSATGGIISQLNRVIKQGVPGLIQTDVPINPGNSGGPLINNEGNVVGMNVLKIQGYESLGFAIPTNVFKPIVDEIIDEYKEQQSAA